MPAVHSAALVDSHTLNIDWDAALEWLKEVWSAIWGFVVGLWEGFVWLVNFLLTKGHEMFCGYAAVDAWILAHLPQIITKILERSDDYARAKPLDFVLMCIASPFLFVVALLTSIVTFALGMMLLYILVLLVGFSSLGPRRGSLAASSQSRYYGSTGVPAHSAFSWGQSRGMRGMGASYFVVDTLASMTMVFCVSLPIAGLFLVRGIYVMLNNAFCPA